MKNAKTMSAFKKPLDKTMHCEHSLGTPEQNRNYCFKGEQSKEEWEEFRESGPNFGLNAITWEMNRDFFPEQGIRSDIEHLRDACEEAGSLTDIIKDENNVDALAKYQNFAKMVFQAAQKKKTREFRKLEVIVNWGDTGLGKTRGPYDEGAFKWEPSTPEWWDGYDGEEILLIDEFYGQLRPSRLLALLDGYQLRLPIKGGFTYARWTKVYISSNVPPDDWYKDVPDKVKQALMRRITTIKEFRKRPREF